MSDVKLPKSEEEDSSDNEDVQGSDDDIAKGTAEHVFKLQYKMQCKRCLTLGNGYLLSICHNPSFSHLAAGSSNGSTYVMNTTERGLSAMGDIEPSTKSNKNSTCGVRFLDSAANSLLIGSTDGVVRLFDLRASMKKEQASFWDAQSGNNNLTCFDCNAPGSILCTGTDEYKENVFLMFYDIRQRKQLGAYFDSHSREITAVTFHDVDPDLVCTGSTDGLINIYDIKETTEDDALTTTINTESSVEKLNWHRNNKGKDFIACITHTSDFKLYEREEGDLVVGFERPQITEAIQRKNPANCNLINAHCTTESEIFLLCGTYLNNGKILRSAQLQDNTLTPLANFEGKSQILRCSAYSKTNRAMLTGGESGEIALWWPYDSSDNAEVPLTSDSRELKIKKEAKTKKYTPY